MEPYKSRKYQVEDLGDEGLKVRVLMPNVEPEQLPTTDIPQDERAETIRQEIAGTNMKDPMHKSAMDKMLGNALEQQEKFNDLAANLNSPVFEPRDVERTNVGNDMTPEPHWLDKEVEAQQQVWAGRGMSSDKAAELQEMADREGLKFADVKKTAPEQGKEQGLDTVERPNYRPFAAHGADKLPEGFSSEVRVAALVVREGARMTPEMPMEGDDFKGWQVNRIFKQDHALFRDGGNRVMVETLNFATQEEAIAAAKKMEKEPADLKTLYEARARSGVIEPDRFDFMTGVIAEKQQEQEQSKALPSDKPLEPEPQEVAAKPSVEKAEEPEKAKEPEKAPQIESAGDIAEDLKKMANRPIQAESLFPQQEPDPAPKARPSYPRKNPPEVLLANPKGKPHVLDHGDKVTVTNRAMLGIGRKAEEKRRKAVETALQSAVDRYGQPVRFHGNRAFLEEAVKIAMERGIALEPGSPMAKEIYERETHARGNQFAPSKPGKVQEVDKDRSPAVPRLVATVEQPGRKMFVTVGEEGKGQMALHEGDQKKVLPLDFSPEASAKGPSLLAHVEHDGKKLGVMMYADAAQPNRVAVAVSETAPGQDRKLLGQAHLEANREAKEKGIPDGMVQYLRKTLGADLRVGQQKSSAMEVER
ncbi:LPD7 domain-containing protein [Acidithiobacillus thiooxidans]|uniref:LPD7 domain-containing protein n=1 Tax=Acidithiobacillus thiooxidans TaxID=930 RepID=UPI001F523CAC|nr:LPD7 domain-containing protein [Acidithiobacillus thiooxidans]